MSNGATFPQQGAILARELGLGGSMSLHYAFGVLWWHSVVRELGLSQNLPWRNIHLYLLYLSISPGGMDKGGKGKEKLPGSKSAEGLGKGC